MNAVKGPEGTDGVVDACGEPHGAAVMLGSWRSAGTRHIQQEGKAGVSCI